MSERWAQIHEIFLFFCETPLPRELPDAERHTAVVVPEDTVAESSEIADEEDLDTKKGKVEVRIEIEKVNLEAVVQFHPAIKKSTEFFAARAIQRCFRRKYQDKLHPKVTGWILSPAVSERSSWHPQNPQPPCGPTVASLLPRIPELTNKYTLPTDVLQRRSSSQEVAHQEASSEQATSHQKEGRNVDDTLPILSVPKLMITRPVPEIIEWKRKMVEEDSVHSSRSSVSVVGETQVPIYNDRLGMWTSNHVVWKKCQISRRFVSSTAGRRSLRDVRPGTADARLSKNSPGVFINTCDGSARVVGIGDRRTIVHQDHDVRKPVQPHKPTSGSARPSSSHLRASSLMDKKNRNCVELSGSQTSRNGSVQGQGIGGVRPRFSTTSLGGTKIKGMSIFSDDPAERKAALDHMSRRGTKNIQTMKMTEDVKELHDQVLQKWRQGKQMHDPFTFEFDQAAHKIQRMGRAWLTRKIVREGKFLRDGMKAWLSAQPTIEFSSTIATIQLSEVLKIFKIFGLCPKVVDSPEILRACLEAMQSSGSGIRQMKRENTRTKLSWSEFQDVCWRLSFKMSEEVSEDVEPHQELDALIQVDEFLRTLVEGKREAFVPNRASAWIRARILDYAELQQQQMLLHAHSEGPKGMSPLRPDSNGTLSRNPLRSKTAFGGSFKRATRGKDSAMRADRRSELARSVVSDTDTRGPKSSKGGSVGVGASVSADGVSAYTGCCVQLELEPIPTLVHQLHGTHLNLSHYNFDEEQIQALAAGLEKNSRVTSLIMMDSGLSSESLCILFEALRRNSSITHADFSENDGFDRAAVAALSDYLAKTHTLKHLTLRGVGLSDVAFDFVVRNGIESNSRSLGILDFGYNMLSDNSLDNIEQIISIKASLQMLDFSWNLLSAAGIKRIDTAVHERSKPRSSKRSGSSRVDKPMPKMTVHLSARMQRLNLMHFTGASGMPRWADEPAPLISQADYVTLRVAQRSPKTTPFVQLRLLRLFTSRRALSPEMAAEQLKCNFKHVDHVLREVAVDVMLKKLGSPELMYELRERVDEEFRGLVDEHIKHVSGSPSGSPTHSRSFL